MIAIATAGLLAFSFICLPWLEQYREAKVANAQRLVVEKEKDALRLALEKAQATEAQRLAEQQAKAAEEKAQAAEAQRLAEEQAAQKKLADLEEQLRAEQTARATELLGRGLMIQPGFPNIMANAATGPQAIGVLEDASGKDNGAIYNGVTLGQGHAGPVLEFNGQDSQIDFGPTTGNVGANDFTIAWWMNTSSAPPGGIQSFLAKRSVCDAVNSLDITIGGGEPVGPGRVQLGLLDGVHGANNLNTTNALNDGQWHHVVWERQADAGKATATEKVYVDGKLNNTATDALVFNISNATHLVMGTDVCIGRNGTVPYRGAADGLEIWNRALSPDEITENYQAGVAGKYPAGDGLIHSWSGQNVAISSVKPAPVASNPLGLPTAVGAVEDSAGNDHAAISGGVTFVSGKLGHAFQFDGQDSQIDFGPDAGNVGANDFTIAWWMNTSSTPPGGIQSFLAKRSVCDAVNSLDITIGGGAPVGPGKVQLGLQDGIHGANDLNTTNALNDGQWHHVVWERQADAGKATATEKVYVDGKLNNTTTDTLVFNTSNTAHLVMGTDVCVGRNGTVPYRGAADGLEIWNRVLSPDEITENYRAGVASKHPAGNGLVHFWSAEKAAIGTGLAKTPLPGPREFSHPLFFLPAQSVIPPNIFY